MTNILLKKDNLAIAGGPEVLVDVSQKPRSVLAEDYCLLGFYLLVFFLWSSICTDWVFVCRLSRAVGGGSCLRNIFLMFTGGQFFRYCENFHAMKLLLVMNLYNWFYGVVCVFY